MKNLEKKIISIINKSPIADKIRSIALFGSYAKGTQTKKSDIDILVELTAPVGFDFFTTEYMLADELKKKVDLFPHDSLNKYLIDEVNKTKKIIGYCHDRST